MVAHFPIDISIKSSSNRKIWVIGRNWSGYITHTAFKLTACLVFVGVCARKSCRSYHAECQYHTRITTTPFSCDIEMKISNKIRSQSVFGHCIFTQLQCTTFCCCCWLYILVIFLETYSVLPLVSCMWEWFFNGGAMHQNLYVLASREYITTLHNQHLFLLERQREWKKNV